MFSQTKSNRVEIARIARKKTDLRSSFSNDELESAQEASSRRRDSSTARTQRVSLTRNDSAGDLQRISPNFTQLSVIPKEISSF